MNSFSETDISLVLSNELLQGLPEQATIEAAVRSPENQLCLSAGVEVIQLGQLSPGLHLVAHGTVEMIAGAPDDGGKIIEFAKAGGMFAEETLFSGQPVRYLARTITPAAILRLPETTLSDWIATSPEFSRRMIGFLSARTDYMQKDMVTFCTKGATARLVCYLVCQFNQAPCTADGSLSLNITVPRNKLAARLGISDSHLSRAFKELEAQGLIVKQRNGIFIPNVQALSKYVCPSGCDW